MALFVHPCGHVWLALPNAQDSISNEGHKECGLMNDSVPYIKPFCIQMIIGVVKEGRAKLYPNANTPPARITMVRRFGYCDVEPRDVALRHFEYG